MPFEFDPKKAASNRRKHGVSFADAEGVLFDPLAVHIPDPAARGEKRFITMGEGSAGAILVVVYTERGETIRLISARNATRQERRQYQEGEAKPE